MEEKKKHSFSNWLEILQQESWQLELLISGFVIFLLIGAYGPIFNLSYQIDLVNAGGSFYQFLYIPYYILLGSWVILIVNLTMHILLRGLWISTIGLRYVSEDIDFDHLALSHRFDKFLRKRIVSFDLYIQHLEKLCSIIFAFTFLIIFLIISIGIFIALITILVFGTTWLISDAENPIALALMSFIILLFLASGSLYFIDFITLGWIKRKERLSKYYFPIYRFYGFITLAFIYRPLYYNLIDNPFGRRVVLFLIPYSIVLMFFLTLTFRTYAFLPDNRSTQSLHNVYYEDSRDARIPSYSASIPSKFISNGYVPLYLPYVPMNDDIVIQEICPDLRPARTGIFLFGRDDPRRSSMDANIALDCSAQRFRIVVNDSLHSDLTYRYHTHPLFNNIGLLTILDIAYLPRGEHSIKVGVKLAETRNGEVTFYFRETVIIPFWKE